MLDFSLETCYNKFRNNQNNSKTLKSNKSYTDLMTANTAKEGSDCLLKNGTG